MISVHAIAPAWRLSSLLRHVQKMKRCRGTEKKKIEEHKTQYGQDGMGDGAGATSAAAASHIL